jgi:hypothetical protein
MVHSDALTAGWNSRFPRFLARHDTPLWTFAAYRLIVYRHACTAHVMPIPVLVCTSAFTTGFCSRSDLTKSKGVRRARHKLDDAPLAIGQPCRGTLLQLMHLRANGGFA